MCVNLGLLNKSLWKLIWRSRNRSSSRLTLASEVRSSYYLRLWVLSRRGFKGCLRRKLADLEVVFRETADEGANEQRLRTAL